MRYNGVHFITKLYNLNQNQGLIINFCKVDY